MSEGFVAMGEENDFRVNLSEITPSTVGVQEEQYTQVDRRNGILNLVGGVSLMLFLGCFYLWANIDVYVLSYFYEFNPDINLGFIFIVDTLLIVANTCGYNIGTYLLNGKRLHPKLIVGGGGSFALIGVFLSSYTKSLAPYLCLYTGMNGLGCGTCYLVPLVCAWEYFPEKKGMMTGIIIGAYGFGSFFFSLISSHLVNPTGANPTISDGDITFYSSDVADRVPMMIRTLVYIWTVLVTIGVLLISRKPKDRVDAAVAKLQQIQGENSVAEKESGYEIKAIKFFVFSKRFWQYYFLMVCGNFFATFFSYTYKEYGENSQLHKPISDQTLTWAASIGGGLVNGSSRLLFGFLQDKYSFRLLLTILMVIQLVVALSVFWATHYPPVYFICVLLNYFSNGGLFAVFPGSVTNVFGLKKGPQIYSLILTASILSSLMNLLMTDILLPATSFAFCFYTGAAVTGIALVILWRFQETLDIENLARVGGLVKE